jgi:hypothetical protein
MCERHFGAAHGFECDSRENEQQAAEEWVAEGKAAITASTPLEDSAGGLSSDSDSDSTHHSNSDDEASDLTQLEELLNEDFESSESSDRPDTRCQILHLFGRPQQWPEGTDGVPRVVSLIDFPFRVWNVEAPSSALGIALLGTDDAMGFRVTGIRAGEVQDLNRRFLPTPFRRATAFVLSMMFL